MKGGFFVGLLIIGLCEAGLLSNVFGDHMVLQRAPGNAQLFGWTKPGISVTVTFSNIGYQATPNSTGYWSVQLNPTPAGGPYNIVVASSEGDSVTLHDILFGDVYICGGQSNMQFTVSQAFNATQEIASANDFPQIRVFTVGQGTISNVTLDELATIEQGWAVSSSSSIGGKDWTYTSALCFLFGKELATMYPNLPIGLISNNWGGTIVQAWSSPDALSKCKPPQEQVVLDAVNPNQNSVLWNAMINPFLGMTINGAIWYQGESNVVEPNYYACAFPAMIQDWRAKWQMPHNPNFPFLFVQLAAYTQAAGNGVQLPEQRIAQTAASALPNVGFATAIDLGDLESPYGNIHPRDKQTVAKRLAACADRIIYGGHGPCIGPVPAQVTSAPQGANTWKVTVTMIPETVDSGLVIQVNQKCEPDPSQCSTCKIISNKNTVVEITSLAVSGEHSVDFFVKLPSGETPAIIAYAFANWPVPAVYSVDGLPLTPFVLDVQ